MAAEPFLDDPDYRACLACALRVLGAAARSDRKKPCPRAPGNFGACG